MLPGIFVEAEAQREKNVTIAGFARLLTRAERPPEGECDLRLTSTLPNGDGSALAMNKIERYC